MICLCKYRDFDTLLVFKGWDFGLSCFEFHVLSPQMKG